jgi:hypothetical protein
MQRFVFVFLCLFGLAACGETRVEIIHEVAGCETDLACDDHDETSVDSCEFDSGICNHERVVVAGLCTDAADCDDGDATSVDVCEDGDCHHTREVATPYDPRAHQDQRSYCEQPLSCPRSEGTVVDMPYGGCDGERYPWNEEGYFILARVDSMADESITITIRPSLRAGDPDDLFRITVEANTRNDEWPDETVLVQDMTAAQLAADGLTVTLARATDSPGAMFEIRFELVEPATYNSRAMQWALLPGGVTDATSGADLVPCPLFGPYVDVPEHGLLRLTEDFGSGSPRCEGTVRGSEEWYARYPGARFGGIFRTVSDPTLRYATDLESPQRIIEFRSMREFLDWFRPPGSWHPFVICAVASVVPDALYEASRATAIVEQVGVRPGTYVSWTDPTTTVRHYGIADKQWTIHDVGTSESVFYATGMGIQCTQYQIYSRFSTECILDLGWLSGYTTVPTDFTSINPTEIDAQSGWLYWYNRDTPTSP